MAEEIFDELNKFRTKPVSFQKLFKTVSKALARAKKPKQAEELENVANNELQRLKPTNPLILSPGLCLAANDELKHMAKSGVHGTKSYEDIKYHVNKFCYDFHELSMMFDHGGYDTMMPRFMISDHDPNREYKKAIFNPVFNYVGIATTVINDDESTVIIFADHVKEKQGKRQINLNDFTELKKAFDCFDINNNGLVEPKELLHALKSLNYDSKNPTVYRIVESLDQTEYELGFDFEAFAIAFDDSLGRDRSRKGLERLFKLFIGHEGSDRLTPDAIKRLARDLNERLGPNEAKEVIERASLSGTELTFDEFYTILSKEPES